MGSSLTRPTDREDDLKRLDALLTTMEAFIARVKTPTKADRLSYAAYYYSFKDYYARLVKNSDSNVEAALTRFNRVNVAWQKKVLPDAYRYTDT